MSAGVPSRTSRPVFSRHTNGLAVSRANRIPADLVERVLLWAFVAGLAWCPFLFGSNVLLAWGINAVLFPGLAAIYEASLLIRGERHPVAIKQIWLPALLFAAVVLWVLIQNATWTPEWTHHPIWQMTADELDKPVAGSITVARDLTSLALLRLITAASAFWIALQLCRDASRANFLLKSIAALSLRLRRLRSLRFCRHARAHSMVCPAISEDRRCYFDFHQSQLVCHLRRHGSRRDLWPHLAALPR